MTSKSMRAINPIFVTSKMEVECRKNEMKQRLCFS
jgi:hypothetical protein